jgi:hypothetical protein
MITAGAAELSRYQLYRRHRLNVGEVTCVNSVKTLSATGDYVNAENRGDRDQRELRQLVAPLRIAGVCGRLMCCLKYEHPLYQDFRKDAPPTGAHVTTLAGPGTVVGHNVPSDTVVVKPAARPASAAPGSPTRPPTARTLRARADRWVVMVAWPGGRPTGRGSMPRG